MELEDVPFEILQEITNDFSEERKLGEGSFGAVYKAVTTNGEDVAVKKLKSYLNREQFRNEFYNLAMLKHKNIVQVLGYCYETKKKHLEHNGTKVLVEEIHIALCLEYLHNGKLTEHLTDESCGLNWHARYKIIKGICEGLKYIHEDLEEPLHHLDLKPDNILLDKDMVPKIADFGLSRIAGKEPTRITNNPYGTRGYQPPEFIDKGEISKMFDIFSLGVIMIAIVSGPKGRSKYIDDMKQDRDKFIHLVKTNWMNRWQGTECDSSLEAYCQQVEICTQIALDCMETESQKRPNIIETIIKLTKTETVITGKVPKIRCRDNISWMTSHNKTKKMRKEHQDVDLMTSSRSNELEFVDVSERPPDVGDEPIVGRVDEKNEIVAALCKSMDQKLTILPIYGIGGIGKTTFAKLICNDTKFRSYHQVWVHVSQRFDLNKICNSIISQLPDKENQMKNGQCLEKIFSGKKILIVLDDIWEDNKFALEDLKNKLYSGDSINTIVLVTTRSKDVAGKICDNMEPHKIKCLTNDLCWEIIKQKSGFEARDDKEHLIVIGREIALKCGGVALAAHSLGFLLKSMTFDQWKEVKDSDIWNASISQDASLPNHVLASLKLSYAYSMDECLRSCFIYCAIFPKGYNIVKDDLIYQWISLGFIKPTKMLSTLQLCEKYIARLLGLSFLQYSMSRTVGPWSYKYDSVLFFTMHDLVHDLAILLLGNQILDKSKQDNTRESSCQYALLTDCSKPLESFTTSPSTLRALHFLECGMLCGDVFAPAMFLRVLDLSECLLMKLPDSIGQLKLLRYLKAPRIRDYMFPECITKLSNLIYLNVRESAIVALPDSIGGLESLMYLDLSCCMKLNELPVTLRNLEKLVHLDLSNCPLKDLGKQESESLGRLSRLEHLNLERDDDAVERTNIITVLKLLVNLTKLRYLNLVYCNVNSQRGGVLECIFSSLSNLEHLDLSSNPCIYEIPSTIGKLRKLHTLNLSHCTELKRLPDAMSEMEALKYLHYENCGSLDKSTLPQYKKSTNLLPNFVVHGGDGESSSNLCQLEYENPPYLEITQLENVKSEEEAQRIKLVEKQFMLKLDLVWTRDAKRLFVDDPELLKQLLPPDTVEDLLLQGYNGVSFPSWMMDIATYLPHLKDIVLKDLPRCNKLPPLGQLPNLEGLVIVGMDGIRKIDGDLYGGTSAFLRLTRFFLLDMECLEEWNTTYPRCEKGLNQLMFPKLNYLRISNCPELRLILGGPLCNNRMYMHLSIRGSSKIIIQQSLEDRGHVSGASYLSAITDLDMHHCEVPLQQWSLLRHLPCLKYLTIQHCSDLTCSSSDILQGLSSLEALSVDCCESIVVLPERLGDLTSLVTLELRRCEGIETLPESIKQLKCLRRFGIFYCSKLVALPEGLGDLTSLVKLMVYYCDGIKTLPESIQQLKCLRCLQFKGCHKLVALPERLGDLTSLVKLTVYNCEGIKTLPESVQQLKRLRRLMIRGSKQLVQWCTSNETKLTHIEEREIRDQLVCDSESEDSDLNYGEDSESEQSYLDSDDEEPETEQDYLDSDDEEPESERDQFDQDSDHQESRVNSVRY